MIILIKIFYWIICNVVVAFNFISCPNPWFYAKSPSLYYNISILTFKWHSFILCYYPMGSYPWEMCHPSVGGGTRERGGFKWLSLRRCAKCHFGAKYLLRQYQSWKWYPLWFPGTQGTSGLSCAEFPGVQPRDCNCDTTINPACDVQNWFVHFRGHELPQSVEYD